jgi:hypothetical protein
MPAGPGSCEDNVEWEDAYYCTINSAADCEAAAADLNLTDVTAAVVADSTQVWPSLRALLSCDLFNAPACTHVSGRAARCA